MTRAPWLVVLMALALPVLVAGQTSSNAPVAATLELSNTALTVGSGQPLAFGFVLPGAPVAIDAKDAGAGRFDIHGARRAEISVTMSLPAVLTNQLDGTTTMPIAFGATDGCARFRLQQANCTYFDPSAPLVDRIRNNVAPNNTYFVWIGGTITPAAAQLGGPYTGFITLTATYTGN